MFDRLPIEERTAAVRAVGIALMILVAPLRAWSLAVPQNAAIYALYPAWLQAVTLAAFAWLGAASLRRTAPTVRHAAAACLLVSMAVVGVSAVASFMAGAWVWWASAVVVCGWIYTRARGL